MSEAVATEYLCKLIRSGGVASFYRGFLPACLSVAPQSGLQFGLYSLLTQLLDTWVRRDDQRLGHGVITLQGSLVCGALGNNYIVLPDILV